MLTETAFIAVLCDVAYGAIDVSCLRRTHLARWHDLEVAETKPPTNKANEATDDATKRCYHLRSIIAGLQHIGIVLGPVDNEGLNWQEVERRVQAAIQSGVINLAAPTMAKPRESVLVPVADELDDNASLRRRLELMESQVETFKRQKKNDVQALRRLDMKLKAEQQRSEELKQQLTAATFFKPNLQRQRLSIRAGMALAIRRTLSNLAAAKVGLAFAGDIHHQTVLAWELRLDAAIKGWSKSWYQHWHN